MIYPCNYIFVSQLYKKTHKGIDIGRITNVSPINPSILAVERGTVYKKLKQNLGGNVLIIKHNISGSIFYSMYGHLKSFKVDVGDTVIKGQEIGFMGNTGKKVKKVNGKVVYKDGKKVYVAVGTHLHFGLYKGEYNHDCLVNPIKYLFLTNGARTSKSVKNIAGLMHYGETRNVSTKCNIRTSPFYNNGNKTGNTLKKGEASQIYGYDKNDGYEWFKIAQNDSLWSCAKYLKK